MRNLIALLTLILSLSLTLSAQEIEETTDSTKNDTIEISWGKKKIVITTGEEEDEYSKANYKKVLQRWNHFAGIDIGVNGFLTNNNSVDLHKEGQFMDLNYRQSFSVAFNPWEWYIPVVKEKIGFSTGMGFEFNNYDLDRDIDIISTKDTTFGVSSGTKDIEKNRFKSSMLNVPLFLETNIGKDAKHSFHLAVGGQISYRLGSKTKQVFEQNDKGYKVKNRNDYNMNDFRFNAVARVGYGDFTLFASYSLTPIFDKDKGPELYPFTVGLSLISW